MQANQEQEGNLRRQGTGAILTGGVSILATGLSRKEAATEAFCTHCKSTWQF